MRKNYFIFLFLFILGKGISAQDLSYKIDENNSVYFEEVIEFDSLTFQQLHKKLMKALTISNYDIIYQDDNEIYGMGKFEVRIRKHALVFFKTDEFNCVYDLKISIKDRKIKFRASNFYLIPQSIKVNTYGFGSVSSSGLSGYWSTTKIPSEIPKRSLDQYYRKNYDKDRNLLFSDVDTNINLFKNNLIDIIQENEDDW